MNGKLMRESTTKPHMTARRMMILIVGLALVAVSCGSSDGGASVSTSVTTPVATTAPATTTTTTVLQSTTVAAPFVPAETQSLIAGVIVEWNSGDTQRWRATFAPEAVTRLAGVEYPIEILQDEHEFFWTLGNHLTFIGCAPADSGDAVVCQAESVNRWGEYLGLPPTHAELRFNLVDDLIVQYQSNFIGANSIRAEWVKFSDWIAERNPEDAERMRAFPGDAEGAQVALGYMDEYFEAG